MAVVSWIVRPEYLYLQDGPGSTGPATVSRVVARGKFSLLKRIRKFFPGKIPVGKKACTGMTRTGNSRIRHPVPDYFKMGIVRRRAGAGICFMIQRKVPIHGDPGLADQDISR